MKICIKCKQNKELLEFGNHKITKDGLNTQCKNCNNKHSREYHRKNPEKGREYSRIRYKNNKEYWIKYFQNNKEKVNEYQKIRKRENPLFRVKTLIRSRLCDVLKRNNWKKNSKLADYLGCSIENLKKHLESKFHTGMDWENHGKWHIDHIIPLASAKTEEELYKLCHYTNLQPLWAVDNLKKGDKY
jgi:hypothetical protein